ncbi:hypothetical protein [Quadrisphaera granulorum]|uniref:hypothetical protein n=1 Tax=Quadrisphaera granulorum TaxID=317664 RepID=UPI0014767F53|nr:hypothetical protein [Quadrisphaera granulorum]
MSQDDDAPRTGGGAASASTALARLVEDYLATLGATSPSTQRQRTWALRELLAHAPASPTAALAPVPVRAWLDTAATADPPASLPGLRARASAVRALTQHAEHTGAVPPGTAASLAGVLRMPAPPLAPGPDPDPVRRLLIKAHPDARPLAVHPAVWTRFCAHVHLLALTGEREDVMAGLRLRDVAAAPPDTPEHSAHDTPIEHFLQTADASESHTRQGGVDSRSSDGSHIDGESVTPPLFDDSPTSSHTSSQGDVPYGDVSQGADSDPGDAGDVVLDERAADGWPARSHRTAPAVATHVRIEAGLAPRSWKLPEPARTALSGWLADRAVLASLLRGSDPGALWLRVRPSTDLRTGALRPAGLPLSDRGLRLAFTTTLSVLALEDRDLEDLSTAAVRAYARGRGPL